MSRSDESAQVQPEVLTLHWEGPPAFEVPREPPFPGSPDEERERLEAERERELAELERTEQGRALWEQIEREAGSRGDTALWRRKLHAYWWVKLRAEGTAGSYARLHRLNHATVRAWIADVAKLAYQVGYRLHEDRLVLVGEASPGLQRLRTLVNRAPGSPEAAAALREAAPRHRGEDPYFHLNEGHVLRAHGRLRESDATLREGLTIAEAARIRSLLWNARGQTFWDCTASSSWPLPDPLARAEKAFRRAAAVDPASFFPFVNLAHLAIDAGDARRCEYWIGELATARRKMEPQMQDALARYLREAEWSGAVDRTRFWRAGPLKWIAEAARRGALVLLALVGLAGLLAPELAAADPAGAGPPVAHDGRGGGGGANSGAGGN
jgi:predicted Zn-dependent protease